MTIAQQHGAQQLATAAWTAHILTAAPLIAPARSFTFPFHVPGEEEAVARGALWLEVRSAAAGSFVAQCALGFATAGVAHGLWAIGGSRLLAVAGGYAYAIDPVQPERTDLLALRPTVAVWAGEHCAALVGYHGVLVLDGDERWASPRLSWEGVELTGYADDVLHGTGWDMQTDEEIAFALDLRRRTVVGGGYRMGGSRVGSASTGG